MRYGTFRKLSIRGTLSLTMLFSTAGGLLFTMLMFNAVRYVSAASTVKEAARQAARCIFPTEGDCAEYARDTSVAQHLEWFGYEPGARPTDVWVDSYDYSAELQQINWRASWNTYLLELAEQPVSWSTYRVPVYRFIPRLERVDRKVDANYEQKYYTPEKEPNFPIFTQNTNIPKESWPTQGFTFTEIFDGAVPFEQVSADPNVSRRVGIFESQVITIDEIPNAENAVCVGNCSADLLAGVETHSETSWRESAFVAIQAFSVVTHESGNPSISWGDDTQALPDGLFVRIWDKNGQPLAWEDNYYGRGLGGFDWQSVPAQGLNYNLWLRGPDDSHGGRPNDKHDQIRVPRGGSFQVVGRMSSRRGVVSAQASIWYYVDRYTEHTVSLSCSKDVSGDDGGLACPGAAECQTLSGEASLSSIPTEVRNNHAGWVLAQCKNEASRPRAITEDERKKALSSLSLPTAAVCSRNWKPGLDSLSLGTQYQVVGYDAEEISKVEVAAIPSSCAEAEPLQPKLSICENKLVVGSKVLFEEDCPNVVSEFSEAGKRSESVNKMQPEGAPQFPLQPMAKLEPQRLTNEKLPAWVPLSRDGKELDPAHYQAIGHKSITPLSLAEPFYEMKAEFKNEQPHPQGSLFIEAVRRESGKAVFDFGWGLFVKNADRYITATALSTTAVKITTGYPFKEPVPEIYYGQENAEKRWDFNRDCRPDAKCEELSPVKRFSSEEEMLRSYAAKEIAQAGDNRYVFYGKSVFSGREFFAADTFLKASKMTLDACLPTQMFCHEGSMGEQNLVSLGVSKDEPELCRDGTYVDCFSKPYGEAQYTYHDLSDISEELVQNVVMREMQRVIPYAKHPLECGDADSDSRNSDSCTIVEIEKSDDHKVRLAVSYRVPLTFPFNRMLGQDGLWVSSSKQDVLEWEAIRD